MSTITARIPYETIEELKDRSGSKTVQGAIVWLIEEEKRLRESERKYRSLWHNKQMGERIKRMKARMKASREQHEERSCDCGDCKYCNAYLSSDHDYETDEYVCSSCNGAGCGKCED